MLSSNLVAFAVGVLASMLAGYINAMIANMLKRAPAVRIEGSWGEYIPDSEHPYTFGRIFLDRKRGFYAFDGTNFSETGEPYCYFETIQSHVDPVARTFVYTFTAHIYGELDKTYYGFGVVNLAPSADGILRPVDGHYISANVDAKPMSHSMIQVPYTTYERGMDGQQVVPLIKAQRTGHRANAGRPLAGEGLPGASP